MTLFVSPDYESLKVMLPERKGNHPSRVIFQNHFYFATDKDEINGLREVIEKTKKLGRTPSFYEKERTNLSSPSKKSTFLLQRMGGLGDILFTTPIIKYLHDQGNIVDYFCHFGFWQTFDHNPYVRKVYVQEELKLAGLGNVPTKMTADQFASYDRPFSFQGVIEWNKQSESLHAVDTCYKWLGIDPIGKPKDIILNVTNQEKEEAIDNLMVKRGCDPRKKFVAIAPNSSGALNRSWKYYDELIEELEDDYNVIYIHRGERYHPKDPHPWTLREMFAIISVMDLVVCVDTGVLHVAGALGKKILTLFGPFNPEYRVKYFKDCHVMCRTKEICGDFCYSHSDKCNYTGRKRKHPPCMNFSPEEVELEVRRLLE